MDQAGTIVNTQFLVDRFEVIFDGMLADKDSLRDLGIFEPQVQEVYNFDLSPCQPELILRLR